MLFQAIPRQSEYPDFQVTQGTQVVPRQQQLQILDIVQPILRISLGKSRNTKHVYSPYSQFELKRRITIIV
jgi:hypothetical protein